LDTGLTSSLLELVPWPDDETKRERWEELAAEGRIAEHPVFPGKHGPASRRIENEADVDDVIALMRINYETAMERMAA